MEIYHIQITLKEVKPPHKIRELIFDLSVAELEQRFLLPYRQGRAIVTDGRTIMLSDIHRFRVYKSKREVSKFATIPWNMMEDVSDEFITTPPGGELESEPRPDKNAREVFVVHGRNNAARLAMFAFLRSIHLNPLEWTEVVQRTGKPSPYIGEILNTAFSAAHAIVVVFTPDDEARLKPALWSDNEPPHETEFTGQARPNVFFEAGMAMGRSPNRTVLVEIGDLRSFSDVAGRYMIRFDGSTEKRQELASRLRDAGCPVNLEGTDWHTSGDVQAVIALLAQETSELLTSTKPEVSIGNHGVQLSDDAKELLLEAVQDRQRMILVVRMMGGVTIRSHGREFCETGNGRSEARWEQAVRDLCYEGLITDLSGKGQGFEVTHIGFELADKLTTPK